MKPTPFSLALTLAFLPVFALPPAGAAPKAPAAVTPELIKQNLDKVPATDPPAPNAPKISESLRGQHPRLLFTAQDIEVLKKNIAADPILKSTYEEVSAMGKKFKLRPELAESLVSNDTPALSTGNGQFPALAYAYALDKDPSTKQGIIDILTMMLNEPHWASGRELDSSMGAACNMMMVAVLYDAAYNDLPVELRTQLAKKLLTHARRMFYLGHKQLCVSSIKYWQQDPQPNHRWYRARGLASCLLAIADEKDLDTSYLMEEMKKEMDFLMKWYPHEGDCHEGSGYQVFGFRSLLETARMMDRNLGTEYLKHPGFRDAWKQQLYYWVPAGNRTISFGDAQNAPGNYLYDSPPFFIGPQLTRDKNAQSALLRMFRTGAKTRDGKPAYPWTLLAFFDPTVGEGDYKTIPTSHLFADLGAASMRDTWEEESVILTFKCGPYGGYKLNEYRHAVPDAEGNPHYVNLAHDDPDANSLAMSLSGDFIFHPGLYATRKMTDTLTTLTVDGKGQVMEGDAYTQPVPKYDMRKLSYLTGWKTDDKGRLIIEGEAGNAYRVPALAAMEEVKPPEGATSTEETPPPEPPKEKMLPEPVLKKFRRSTLWMPGEYILILDDIVSDGPRQLMWRGTVEKAQFIKPEDGRCQILTKGGKQVDMQMLGNKPFQGAIDHMYLAGRWGNELIQQLQFSLKSDSVKFACLLDPWKQNATLTLKETDDTVTLNVRSEKFNDTWTWKSAKDNQTPSAIEGKRGETVLIALTEKDKAPHGD